MKSWEVVVKRLMDAIISFFALLILSPVLAIIALVVRLTSPGPVLFRQTRLGKDSQPFICHKFRTMYVGAPDIHNLDGSTYNAPDDYIDDLVHATLSAVHSERATNSIINIGSGTGVSIKELVNLIEEATGVSAIVRFSPARSFDVPASVLAIHQARTLLDWSPTTSLKEGLKKTIPWIKDYLLSKTKRGRNGAASDEG